MNWNVLENKETTGSFNEYGRQNGERGQCYMQSVWYYSKIFQVAFIANIALFKGMTYSTAYLKSGLLTKTQYLCRTWLCAVMCDKSIALDEPLHHYGTFQKEKKCSTKILQND